MPTAFDELFRGAAVAHGAMTRENKGWTADGAATAQDYARHLAGDLGLGIVPLKEDGTCHFAALDIDVDTIDHQALRRKVAARNLPLTVCRSRSGAAHLYCFFNPPRPAAEVRRLLRAWSGLLGYPACEVFPKQDRVDESNRGSWLNLPYFGGDSTTRYAVGPEGALTLAEFLAAVEFYDPTRKIGQELPQLGEDDLTRMPPCLESLTRSGLGEGGRNDALLNYAILFRKMEPNAWEARVRQFNKDSVNPPLDDRELQGIIQSVGRRGFGYTCERPVVKGRCDRERCLGREFGINHTAGQEHGRYHTFTVKNLRKIPLEPPKYIVEVNGTDLTLEAEQLESFAHFKKACLHHLHLMLLPTKQDRWETLIKEMIETVEILSIPSDAGKEGLVMVRVADFLGWSERSRAEEDILKGIPYRNATHVWFRSGDLINFLGAKKVTVDPGDLFELLNRHGGRFEQRTIKGHTVTVWGLPAPPRQTEPFTPPAAPEGSGEPI